MSYFERFYKDVEGTPSISTGMRMDVNWLSGRRKLRIIHAPNDHLKKVLARFRAYLLELDVSMPSACGSVPRSNPARNIARHRRADGHMPRHLFSTDIRDAYGAVPMAQLTEVLVEVDGRDRFDAEEAHSFLASYCSHQGGDGLVVGLPGSQDLFNIYLEVCLDRELRVLCRSYDIHYTRYLDDLLFSSDLPIGKRKRCAILNLVRSAGMQTVDHKTEVLDLRKGPVRLNGVGVDASGRLFLPRVHLRRITGLLHRAVTKPKTVTRPQIDGLMGVFWSCTEGKSLAARRYARFTQSERRVIELYETYRSQQAA